MVTKEERKRGMYGGVSLALAGVPLALFYGIHPFGFLGIGLVGTGFIISYGAYIYQATD